MIATLLEHHAPWLYMSAFFERYKDEYVENMFSISANGEWQRWIEFCLRGTREQAEDSILRCDLLKGIQQQYYDAIDPKRPRVAHIVERLFSAPAATIPEVSKAFSISYKTAKSDIDHLISAGILKPIEDTNHPKVFFAPAIASVIYADKIPPSNEDSGIS